MKPLLGNILLALAWLGITGQFTLLNFVFGFALGFGVLWLIGPIIGAGRYTGRAAAAVALAGVFLWQLTLANGRVAYDVLTPGLQAVPAIVRLDLDATGDFEILLLAILVTLTPGSVVVDISEDRRHMYVYFMYADDPEDARRRLKEVFERRVLQVTR